MLMPQKNVTARDNLIAAAVIGGFVVFLFCAAHGGWDVPAIFGMILGASLAVFVIGPLVMAILAVLLGMIAGGMKR
jgi:hypothetical protein